ncbi:MAG: hypothetical protein CVV27_21715 [Candidatus Melainabacteria bacterium HGW-Melainabacteria-1]|jgi:hypothetical protein|nr:MAG: hypothetical protein CVV27_21715 [Candidatus Melainabacteria bacterium HGW-Melainabacteria-1]PKQ20107.1 MAG: hypothetical protein CVT66_06485 [Actinobacteria bacterium HGW-Actinobacteria-6]
MTVAEAQLEMRTSLLGGFMGQLVSGILWLASAGLATWGTDYWAIGLLIVGGFFIYPLTLLGLKLIGRPAKISQENPFNRLGMQVAFVLPLSLPVVGAAALYRPEWFYPAFMIVLGAHYLPFVTLYGMRVFYLLAGILVSAGIVLALYVTLPNPTGAWITGVVLILFAFIGRWVVDTTHVGTA